MPAVDRLCAVAMFALSGWCALALLRRRPGALDQLAAGALLLLATVWLLRSPAYEGPSIVSLTSTAGLTAADAGVPPCLFLGGSVLWARRRRSGQERPRVNP